MAAVSLRAKEVGSALIGTSNTEGDSASDNSSTVVAGNNGRRAKEGAEAEDEVEEDEESASTPAAEDEPLGSAGAVSGGNSSRSTRSAVRQKPTAEHALGRLPLRHSTRLRIKGTAGTNHHRRQRQAPIARPNPITPSPTRSSSLSPPARRTGTDSEALTGKGLVGSAAFPVTTSPAPGTRRRARTAIKRGPQKGSKSIESRRAKASKLEVCATSPVLGSITIPSPRLDPSDEGAPDGTPSIVRTRVVTVGKGHYVLHPKQYRTPLTTRGKSISGRESQEVSSHCIFARGARDRFPQEYDLSLQLPAGSSVVKKLSEFSPDAGPPATAAKAPLLAGTSPGNNQEGETDHPKSSEEPATSPSSSSTCLPSEENVVTFAGHSLVSSDPNVLLISGEAGCYPDPFKTPSPPSSPAFSSPGDDGVNSLSSTPGSRKAMRRKAAKRGEPPWAPYVKRTRATIRTHLEQSPTKNLCQNLLSKFAKASEQAGDDDRVCLEDETPYTPRWRRRVILASRRLNRELSAVAAAADLDNPPSSFLRWQSPTRLSRFSTPMKDPRSPFWMPSVNMMGSPR